MAYYNLTNVTVATNPYEIAKATNQLSEGYYGVFILSAFWFILFIGFKRGGFDTRICLLATNFISLIVSILLYFIEFVPQQAITILIAFFAISLFMELFNQR